ALDLIPTLKLEWDLVFIDADKENYSNYFDLVIDRVRSGGWIIADNVLGSGKVLKPADRHDQETAALKAFNQKVHQDPRVTNLLLPVRDGMMILIKK
ncbi:MAG: methyltransferase, partial [Flavobacteriales bacterium]|nr:methyltransferase [Flavobacteriales bacterium]